MARESRIDYKKWMPHNIEVIKKKCKHYLVVDQRPMLINILTNIAQSLINFIENDARIPEDTSNLRDATGIGIYIDGSLAKFVPAKKATKKQKSGFHYRNEYGIDGAEYLSQAIADASTSFNNGIWIVLFSAVPYAYFLNNPELVGNLQGKVQGNFFGEISAKLVEEIYAGLAPLRIKNIPLWV